MDRCLRRLSLPCLLALVSAATSSLAAPGPGLALPFATDPATRIEPSAAPSADPRLGGGYKFNQGGWTFVHLEGSPEQVGFQHGYLLAREIEDNVGVYEVTAPNADKRPWSFFREAGQNVLWPHLDPEYQEELKGIAEGLKAQGSKIDLWDIVALNGDLELSDYYLPMLNAAGHKANPPAAVAPGKCSAFIATGSATKDGKIVIAHSNWSSYADGERWTVVFDIVPASGQHFLMDGLPGGITSADDFGVNASGLMITETTLPMASGFDVNGIPEFQRSRKAMQYATSIDEYAAIMRKGNNGGYANSWLVGDRKTGEIAYLELGLHNTPLSKKKDGYFVSDHYDTYEKKEDAGKRSLCGHEETSPVGEKVWDNPPYSPSGAVSGKVMDSDLAANLSFIGRAGHPCGEDFLAAPFFAKHPEFAWQKPILHDMKAGPWTTFTAGERQ